MPKRKWIEFPHDAARFRYNNGALAKKWSRLHAGDCEPFPNPKSLAARMTEAESADQNAKSVAAGVLEAWAAFHAGDFRRAYDLGMELGLPGSIVAIKSAGAYAGYLEKNDQKAQELLLSASQHASDVFERLPKEKNAHYLFAFTLGRYSQRISILEALTRGLAPKIEHALQQALKLEPKHADAHVAFGLFHAEIVGKLGSLAAGLTYGASSAKAIEHFKKAVKLNPHAAIAKLEYAHGLKLLDADEHADAIDKLLHEAAKCEPTDALELLDIERAKGLAAA